LWLEDEVPTEIETTGRLWRLSYADEVLSIDGINCDASKSQVAGEYIMDFISPCFIK
jgi:hypothetical protein